MRTIIKTRTADAILRDLVEARSIMPGKYHDEAVALIAAQDADALWRKKIERDDAAERKRREDAKKRSLGKFEIAPQHEGGVDHSSLGIVLLRKGGERLVWRKGAKYWNARDQSYAPAELEILQARPGGHGFNTVAVTEHHRAKLRGERRPGARLSERLLFLHGKQIDKHFGADAWKRAADAFHSKETITL